MAEQLPVVSYGTVVGRFLAAVADGTEDADLNPDGIPVTGSVTFTPSVSAILVDSSVPPVTILPTPITATLDAQGYLSLNGVRGIKLVATDSSFTNPTAFTYEVSFKNMRYAGGANVNYPSYSIAVPTDSTTDLSLTAPVPTSTGNPVLRDEATVIDAANRAQRSADIASSIADEVIHGTYSGVGFQALTGVSQPLTSAAYTILQFNTVVTDTVHAFDTATGLYTIPVSGMWDVAGTVRFSDASVPAGSNIGIGIAAQNGDIPGFSWQTAGAFRNTFQVARAIYFTAGDKVRLYVYHEVAGQVTTQSATLSLNLVTAAAVPSASTPDVNDDHRLGGRVQPVTNGNADDLIQSGWYGGYNVKGAPSVDAYHFQVIRSQGDSNDGVGRVWQQARGYDGANADVTYERTYRDAVWTPWVRLSNNYGAIDQAARDNLVPLNAGGRLGVQAKEIANADLNTIQDQGWYLGGSNSVNGVGFGRFIMQVSSAGAGYTHQRMLGITGDLIGNEYTRLTYGGPGSSWTAWKRIADLAGAVDGGARAPLITGGRLGARGADIGVTSSAPVDANSLTDQGWFMGSGIVNAPTSNFCYVQVQAHTDAGWLLQTWTEYAKPDGAPIAAPRRWTRQKQSNAWQPYVLDNGFVRTINGVTPDANGGVTIPTGGSVPPRLDTQAANTDYQDVNTLTASGWYSGEGMPNAPTADGRWIIVTLADPEGMVEQHAYQMRPDVAAVNRLSYYRQCTGDFTTGWSGWVSQTNGSSKHPAVAFTGTTIGIDGTQSTTQVVTLSGAATVSFGTAPTAGAAVAATLTLKQDATGSRTVTWPASILWEGSSAPVLSTTPGAVDRVVLSWDGVEWIGSKVSLAFGKVAVATTKAIYTQSATSPLNAYATEGNVTMNGGVLTLTPPASQWAGGVKAFLATTDNLNGNAATGTPAAVADYTHTYDLEFADLGQQYLIYVIRARSKTYQGAIDDIWTSGNGAGNPKTGYFVQFSIQEGILSVWDASTGTQIGGNIAYTFPNRLMRVKVVVAGQSLQLRVWAQGAAEPTTWAINNPTALYNRSGGTVGFVQGNGPTAVSKPVKITNQVLTTPIITAGASVAAPTADPRSGFTRIYTENFNTPATTGTGASSVLAIYGSKSLQFYNDEGVYYPRATTSVHDGYLDVNLPGDKGAAFVFGGTDIAYNRIGGRFAFRAMAIDAIGNGTATMVWPSSEVWADGEIDYPESNFEDAPMGHHHYMIAGQEASSDNFGTGVDWRAWHEYAVEWFPPGTTAGGSTGKVDYYVDNNIVATIKQNVPKTAHRFMFQIGNYGQPGHFLVDYATMSSLN
jgi:hypothetical protein